MKIGLGMEQQLNMAPILEITIPIGQFRSALKLGKSIGVFCSKNRDAENELGEGMAGLCIRDFGVATDLNRKVDERNDDANRTDDLSEIREVAEIHVKPALRRKRLTRSDQARMVMSWYQAKNRS